MNYIERPPPEKVRAAGAGLRQTALQSTPTSNTRHDSTAILGEQDRDAQLERARCAKIAAVSSFCHGWLDRGHLEQLFRLNPLWQHA